MITDAQAREIAASWHGGGGSALYALASTGAIDTARADHDVAREITECAKHVHQSRNAPNYPTGYTERDFTNLIDLRTYTRRHGKRGPIANWHKLTS